MKQRPRRPLTRRRFGGAVLAGLAVAAVGLGPACGDDADSGAGSRDDPFPYADPNARCGNVRC